LAHFFFILLVFLLNIDWTWLGVRQAELKPRRDAARIARRNERMNIVGRGA
jgi:hypothetical protein